MNTSAATLRKSTFFISALSILPHIFCCGIPVVAATVSLGATAGLATLSAAHPFYQFVDSYHQILLSLALASVLLSGALNLVAYRIDCRAAAASPCRHASCAPKKLNSFKIFFLSCALLALDLSWFATEKYALHLHAAPHAHHAQK